MVKYRIFTLKKEKVMGGNILKRKNRLVFIWALVILALALTLGSCGTASEMPSESVLPTTQPVNTTETVPATVAATEATTQATTRLTTEATTHPTTVPETQATESTGTGIEFISWPETTAAGETVTVTIKGQPDTSYSITVCYKSGASKASGLECQTSDSEGYASWTWRIGSRTSPGTFKIEVSGGGERETVKFTIAE